jgi:hypothetical protein
MTFNNMYESSKHRMISTDDCLIPKHASFNKFVLSYLQSSNVDSAKSTMETHFCLVFYPHLLCMTTTYISLKLQLIM